MAFNSSQLSNELVINECPYLPILPDSVGNYFMITLTIFTTLIAIPGNLITILTILHSRKLRKKITYVFVISVSFADFLVGLLAQPLFVANMVTNVTVVKICKIGVLAAYICGAASIAGIIGVTLERFIYIVFPFRYNNLLSLRKALLIIALLWSIGVVLAAVHIVCYDVKLVQAAIFILIVTSSFVSLSANLKFLHMSIKAQSSTSTGNFDQIQITKLILKVSLAFGVCWLPYGIVGIMYAFYTPGGSKNIIIAYYWCAAIGFCNSTLNILIYAKGNTVLSSEIRQFLKFREYRNTQPM